MSSLYHEKQLSALCGVHAINNLLQGPLFGAGDLATIAHNLDERERALLEGAELAAALDASHRIDVQSGDFSMEVLAEALAQHSLHLVNVDHASVAEAIASNPEAEEGYLVHRSSHWFGLRRIASMWWNVDSKLPRPVLIADDHLATFITKLRLDGHTLHVVRSDRPMPLPSHAQTGIGHEAVFHPIDYLLDQPPLDPSTCMLSPMPSTPTPSATTPRPHSLSHLSRALASVCAAAALPPSTRGILLTLHTVSLSPHAGQTDPRHPTSLMRRLPTRSGRVSKRRRRCRPASGVAAALAAAAALRRPIAMRP